MQDENTKELEEKLKDKHAERNYNFFRPVGQFIEHVDTVNFSMDKDGNFQFENVGQVNGAPSNHMQKCTGVRSDEDCFQFIHPALDEEQSWQIHNEVKRLVISQGIQEICLYLKQMADDKKILLPLNAEKMYNELVRLGMPNGEGYALKTFRNTYKR